ncbi:hypothetical protein [Arthrobacter zhaoxinii]|uniref:hypothetical protein n=1 Tax=Arthrobacter zhaoxinii TaxID=2964616 RepID=UPI002106C651|nr:hypothetical protein [Arthrobacter zhaoxinii]MCQ2001209.1 hypothetical protein [Arthrobacter zhaoxinii]
MVLFPAAQRTGGLPALKTGGPGSTFGNKGASSNSLQSHPVVVCVSSGRPPHVVLAGFAAAESHDGLMHTSPMDPDFDDGRVVFFDSRPGIDAAGIRVRDTGARPGRPRAGR